MNGKDDDADNKAVRVRTLWITGVLALAIFVFGYMFFRPIEVTCEL
jgi:hypothetical protein